MAAVARKNFVVFIIPVDFPVRSFLVPRQYLSLHFIHTRYYVPRDIQSRRYYNGSPAPVHHTYSRGVRTAGRLVPVTHSYPEISIPRAPDVDGTTETILLFTCASGMCGYSTRLFFRRSRRKVFYRFYNIQLSNFEIFLTCNCVYFCLKFPAVYPARFFITNQEIFPVCGASEY